MGLLGIMRSQQYDIGMVGLGVMGRNLLLNIAEHGFSLAGYDKDFSKAQALKRVRLKEVR